MTPPFSPKSGWFNLEGPDQDVVLSTRTRFSRNLDGIPFSGKSSSQDEKKVLNAVGPVLKKIKDFTGGVLGLWSPLERRVLVERGILDPQTSLHPQINLFLNNQEDAGILILSEDHLKFFSFQGGLSVNGSVKKLIDLVTPFDETLKWSFSPIFGFLNSKIRNTGSGFKISFFIHIPGIERFGLLGKILQTVEPQGFSLNGVYTGEVNTSFYILANRFSAGLTVETILKTGMTLMSQVVSFERSARKTWFEHHGEEIQDQIWRAYGLLKYARTLDPSEAWDLLAKLRLGICYGAINDVNLKKILPAFFLSQKSHLMALGRENERCAFLKEILFTEEVI